MSRSHPNALDLARLLDSTSDPLYVLDEDLAIVFLNRACREWLGAVAEELPGRRCVFSTGSELEGADAVAAQLCPPPAVLGGREIAADVAKVTDRGLVYRRARFVPLSPSADDLIGVVALLDAEDRAEPSPPPAVVVDNESIALHEHLRRLRRQATLRFGMERLVGTSPAARRAQAQAELAAGSLASVLLVGPAGVGRRHVAESIHYAARPEPGMLVPLDCAMLGADLVQAALRAVLESVPSDARAGAVTLLLIDADQLPAESQAVIVAMLSARRSPLRPIATAPQSLTEAARHGRYREDLASLLSTITIELPPLASRREDIAPLAQALLEEANTRSSRQLGGFSSDVLDRLDAYAWPGNIGELAQVVAEAHQRAAGLEITLVDLPDRLHLAAEAAARPRRKEETIVLDEFLARIERELIRRALARAKGNKAKAARLLGLNRPRLYRRMLRLGLLDETEDS